MEALYRYKHWPGPYPPAILLSKEYINLIKEFLAGKKIAAARPTPSEISELKTIFGKNLPSDLAEWWWIFGGRRDLHVHYLGDIYNLTKPQWNELSKSMMNMVATKLSSAPAISFEQSASLLHGFASAMLTE